MICRYLQVNLLMMLQDYRKLSSNVLIQLGNDPDRYNSQIRKNIVINDYICTVKIPVE